MRHSIIERMLTAEEVEQAVEDLKLDILEFKYSSATSGKPIEVTELISQPHLTKVRMDG